jgi:lipoate-protein ligase A
VNEPFGAAPLLVTTSPVPRTATQDTALVRDRLAALSGSDVALLDIAAAAPTAAFSRRDTLLAGYEPARTAVTAHGFAPMIRPVGGHLAVYGPGCLVVHLWAPHPEPRTQIKQRFALFGGAVARSFQDLGVDARVGPVPGEYCEGEFSVNDSGRAKLVGTGQRIVRSGYLFSAVVMVHVPPGAREALIDAYREMGLDLRPDSVGCLADSVPDVSVGDVQQRLAAAIGGLLGRPDQDRVVTMSR